MIRVACPSCQTKYRFDESQLGGKTHARAKCQKCGETIEIGPAEATLEHTRPSGPAPSAPAPTPAPAGPVGAASASAPAPVPAPTGENTTARVRRLRSDEDAGNKTVTGQAAISMELPPDKKYSLAVLQGKASGQIFVLNKVRSTLGRADSDIILDDPECSRQHATLEILGARVVVTDLGSTNGTFVGGEQIERRELENHHEFRIGEHVLMLIVTDRD